MLIKISHDFDASADAFFDLYFDTASITRMYREYMQFPEFDAQQTDDADRIRRTI